MLTTNPAFYRSTRESAFSLVLTFAQIELLVTLHKHRLDSLSRREAYLLKNPGTRYPEYPEFVDKGDGTDCAGYYGWHKATMRCLIDKGLITGLGGLPVFTQAGHLAFQMLQVSGHVQEINWAQDKVVAIQQED